MKNQLIKTKILWGVGAMISLSIFYILSRHDILGQWHNMYQWPIILFVFGLIVVIAAATLCCQKVMICTVAGYIVGFILAKLFNSDYAGSGDTINTMSYNNGWKIWTCVYIIMIVAGIVWEVVYRRTKGRKVKL